MHKVCYILIDCLFHEYIVRPLGSVRSGAAWVRFVCIRIDFVNLRVIICPW